VRYCYIYVLEHFGSVPVYVACVHGQNLLSKVFAMLWMFPNNWRPFWSRLSPDLHISTACVVGVSRGPPFSNSHVRGSLPVWFYNMNRLIGEIINMTTLILKAGRFQLNGG
jgi:hypothetical protein